MNKTDTYKERYASFEDFLELGENIFEDFKRDFKRRTHLDEKHEIHICPKGKCGNDDSKFEIYFGLEPDCKKNDFHYPILENATLLFSRNDDGYVTIFIFTGSTESASPKEKFYVFRSSIHPSKLSKKSFLYHCWKYFLSCAKCTAYLSRTSLGDKMRYNIILQFTKRYGVENYNYSREKTTKNIFPSRIYKYLTKTTYWVFNIGLSGLLVTMCARRIDHNSNETLKSNIDTITRNSCHLLEKHNTIIENQNSIRKELINKTLTLDSTSLQRIEDMIKEQNWDCKE